MSAHTPSNPRKLTRRIRKGIRDFFVELRLFLAFIWRSFTEFLYEKTLPVTRRLLSKRPTPPLVQVQDIRANRIRLNIQSSFSSIFNVEVFEVEWAANDGPADEWTSVGFSEIRQRTVARLKGDTTYHFRVRAKNERGTSGWSEPVVAKTKQTPVDGGGYGPRYTWTQTPTEVTITFKLDKSTTKWDVKLFLKSDFLKVQVARPQGYTDKWDEMVMEGQLHGKVASFDNGSFWEMMKEDGMMVLNVILEKQSKSVAPKFDYWRSIHPGHPELEIDTHMIASEDNGAGMQMLRPGEMDAGQLQAMRLGQYASR